MASYGTVKYGDKGTAVSDLQTMLNQSGYGLTVDGIFGDKTLSAVKQYQQANGLSVDCIVGVNTWGALTGAGSQQAGGPSPTTAVDYTAQAESFAGQRPTYVDNYGDAPTYTQSQGLRELEDLMAQYESARPDAYQSGYQAQIDELLSRIQGREPFQYDFNADPLYHQYKDQYLTQGRQAMENTMGNAAALSGGYGNSYAATAGNQAYQQHVQQLNNILPSLQNSAYTQYRDQGTAMHNEMNLLRGLDRDAYGRYRDDYGDWQIDRDYYSGKYSDQYSREYDAFLSDLRQWNADRSFDYGQYTDAYDMWAADRDFAYKSALSASQQQNWEMEYALAQQKAAGTAKSSGSSGKSKKTADTAETGIDGMSEGDLYQIALNLYKNAGMTNPLSRVEQTSYTAGQKAYLKQAIQGMMKS